MFEQIILGIVQGIAEWLPISSEGMIILVKTHFFPAGQSFASIVRTALFLHLGTFFAALIYFRKDVLKLCVGLLNFRQLSEENKKIFSFLLYTTIISGCLGFGLMKIFEKIIDQFDTTGRVITLCVGCLLFITAYLEIKAKKSGYRPAIQLTLKDSLILGIAQGFAVLPGLSRSGLTVSSLLLLKFDKTTALKLSFLMSLPIVLAGNIILNINELTVSANGLVGLLFSFIFGLATIHLLLKLAEKVNFGYFMIGLGLLTVISAFI